MAVKLESADGNVVGVNFVYGGTSTDGAVMVYSKVAVTVCGWMPIHTHQPT